MSEAMDSLQHSPASCLTLTSHYSRRTLEERPGAGYPLVGWRRGWGGEVVSSAAGKLEVELCSESGASFVLSLILVVGSEGWELCGF